MHELPERYQKAVESLRSQFPNLNVTYRELDAELELQVCPAELIDVARYLKEAPELGCKYLRCLSGVDYSEYIQLVYNLSSMHSGVNVYLKVDLPRDVELPEVESVSEIWPTADWHEREIYDLLGVRFLNHPDLRRILLPEDFQGGFPLRKDFVDKRPPRERKVRKR